MFLSDSVEAKTDVIEIYYSSCESVEKFLEYLYVGEVEEMGEFVEQLFVLADKYAVKPLKVRELA